MWLACADVVHIWLAGDTSELRFLQVIKPLGQVLSSLTDQDSNNQMDQDNVSSDSLQKSYTTDEFEVRIFEPERAGGHWETRAIIPMQTLENALTVRMVTLFVSSSKLVVQFVAWG